MLFRSDPTGSRSCDRVPGHERDHPPRRQSKPGIGRRRQLGVAIMRTARRITPNDGTGRRYPRFNPLRHARSASMPVLVRSVRNVPPAFHTKPRSIEGFLKTGTHVCRPVKYLRCFAASCEQDHRDQHRPLAGRTCRSCQHRLSSPRAGFCMCGRLEATQPRNDRGQARDTTASPASSGPGGLGVR